MLGPTKAKTSRVGVTGSVGGTRLGVSGDGRNNFNGEQVRLLLYCRPTINKGVGFHIEPDPARLKATDNLTVTTSISIIL